MFNIWLKFIIYGYDFRKDDMFYILDGNNPYFLPSFRLKQIDLENSINYEIKEFVKQYIDVDVDWLDIKVKDIEKIYDKVFITYEVEIPGDLLVLKGTRIYRREVMSNNKLVSDHKVLQWI